MNNSKSVIHQCQKYMQYIYLILFTGIVLKYYLLTTMLENSYTYDIYLILKWTLLAYVIVNTILVIITKQYESWFEIALMVALVVCGAVVSYTIGDVEVFDITLLIVGAKNVPWKKIAYCYLCVAIVVQLVVYYGVKTGVIANITYESDNRGLRQSYGIIYPTDFAAHILFIMLVYTALRERKLTFAEISVMAVLSYWVFQRTNARNDFICSIVLCVLLLIVKLLRVFKIQLSKYKILKIGGIAMFVLVIVCILAATFYDPSNATYQKLDGIFSSRISLSYQGLEQYGIQPFGSYVLEDKTLLGYYFFLDSSFIRIAIRYGWVFLSLITFVYMLCFEKAVDCRKDYIIVALLVMMLFGITEHHMIEIAYCPIWYMLFSKMKPNKLIGKEGKN